MNKVDYAKVSSDNIKFLLIKNNMSIRQLAERIGVAPTTLNDSLKSKKGVSIDSLIKIADCFNLTVNDLCNSSLIELENTSKSDIMFINKFSLLDSHGRDIVSLIIDKELERIMNEP